jgi:hypothetical protein
MSMYYSPEIVQLLMKERLQEAADRRRAVSGPSGVGRAVRTASSLRRLLPLRPAPAACAC